MSGYGIVGASLEASARLEKLGWQAVAPDFMVLDPGDLTGVLTAVAALHGVALPEGCRLFALADSVDLSALFARKTGAASGSHAPVARPMTAEAPLPGFAALSQMQAQVADVPIGASDPFSAFLMQQALAEDDEEDGVEMAAVLGVAPQAAAALDPTEVGAPGVTSKAAGSDATHASAASQDADLVDPAATVDAAPEAAASGADADAEESLDDEDQYDFDMLRVFGLR